MPTDLRAALSQSFGTRFRVERELGRGGMATVYLVHDAKHGRDVALKVLHPELAASIGRERFLREIAFAARLTHPNILPLYESGEAGDALFYLMPYAEGDTLRTRLTEAAALPIAEALRIARDVARALAYAHVHNVLHRDIKPGNILLESGSAVVADFGIARAVSRAADDVTLTDSGLLIGTPAYMAPELAGGREPDGRADIYALGCVLYQMLAGDPPFTGSSARAILARHALDAVPPLETVRPGLSPEVAAVVTRALQKVPADRYADAEQMANALDDLLAATTASRISASVERPRRQVARLPVAVGLTALVGAAVWWGAATLGRPDGAANLARLDTTRYAVLPIEGDAQVRASASADQSFRDAVARWQGVSVAGVLEMREILARRGAAHLTSAAAQGVAAAAGAGRYFRGDFFRAPDGTLRLHAALYSTRDNTVLADSTALLRPDLADADSAFAIIAERLLLRRPARGLHAGGGGGSFSLPARQEFLRGVAAMERWDLDAADSAFAAAGAHDPRYAAADLWLALVRSWAGVPVAQWQSAVTRAASGQASLVSADTMMLRPLLARADGDLVAACAAWARLTAVRPEDFVGWYGSADCQHADSTVMRDSGSPTGYRFRTSYHSALAAYQHAFRLLPSALSGLKSGSFEGLRRLFVTTGSQLRAGFGMYPDSARYAAYPAWLGDTLAYVPAPLREVMELRPGASPNRGSRAAAMRHQRALFLDIARTWTTEDPHNSDAYEALAVALSLLQERTALDTLLKARSLAVAADRRTELAVAEVFLRVRRALPLDTIELLHARRLADSILATTTPTAATALGLMSLGMLTGRGHVVWPLARLPGAAGEWSVAPPLAGLALPLLMFSALGGPAESLDVYERKVTGAIARDVADDDQESERLGWLGRSATLAYPTHRAAAIATLAGHGDPLIDAMAAHARGDRLTALRLLAQSGRSHEAVDPADVSLEGLYPEAWLLARLGDEAGAADRMDPTLESLPRAAPEMIDNPVAAAALVRAMALRSILADRLGHPDDGRVWTRAVRILWGDADGFLRPLADGG